MNPPEELLPCPFCGEQKAYRYTVECGGFDSIESGAIRCGNCGGQSKTASTSWKDIEAHWNTRTPSKAEERHCGCISCVCEDEEQCQGCGSHECQYHQTIRLERDTLRTSLAQEGQPTDEPNPNGTTHARLNWWKDRCDELQNEKAQAEQRVIDLQNSYQCACETEKLLQARIAELEKDKARLDWATANHVEIAELLHSIGWRSPNDAQWEKLKLWLSAIRPWLDAAISAQAEK